MRLFNSCSIHSTYTFCYSRKWKQFFFIQLIQLFFEEVYDDKLSKLNNLRGVKTQKQQNRKCLDASLFGEILQCKLKKIYI